MKPWISIIVPIYNVENYLERCLNSLIEQTFKSLEIILVDDGSTDSSGKICEYYKKKHKNIKVIHKINGGLASARNEGLKYVQGEYVAFVDSDDWIEKKTYQILFERSKKNSPDIITYGYQKINNGKIIIKEVAEFSEGLYLEEKIRNLILPESIAREKAFNQVNLPVQLSACMNIYKDSFLKENNLKFESERLVLSEDWLFNISCLCRAKSFQVIHEIFYNYDTRGNSLSMSFKPDSYERKCNLYKRYKEEIIKTNNFNDITKLRLRNFWVEAIYGCYIIEINAPILNIKRINKLFLDSEFKENISKLNFKNCTLKGILFKFIVRFRLNSIFKYFYLLKKRNMRLN